MPILVSLAFSPSAVHISSPSSVLSQGGTTIFAVAWARKVGVIQSPSCLLPQPSANLINHWVCLVYILSHYWVNTVLVPPPQPLTTAPIQVLISSQLGHRSSLWTSCTAAGIAPFLAAPCVALEGFQSCKLIKSFPLKSFSGSYCLGDRALLCHNQSPTPLSELSHYYFWTPLSHHSHLKIVE